MKAVLSYIFAPFAAGEREIKSLHGLRALSVLGIIVFHVWDAVDSSVHWMPEMLTRYINNLPTTVNLFFMLSGYLITAGLLHEWGKNGRINFKEFYLKRTLRIFPAYYVLVFFTIFFFAHQLRVFEALPSMTADQRAAYEGVRRMYDYRWSDIFYVSNYAPAHLVTHGWTLSVEEQYYLIFPLLASIFLFRVGRTSRLAGILGLYAVPLCARLYYIYQSRITGESAGSIIYSFSHTRYDAILTGVAIAVVSSDWREEFGRFMKAHAGKVLAVSLLLYVGRHSLVIDPFSYAEAFSYNLADAAYGGMIMIGISSENWFSRLLSVRPLIPVAKLSYSMYLWHAIMCTLAINAHIVPGQDVGMRALFLMWGSAIVRSFLMGWLMFLIVESPFMKLRDVLVRRMRKKAVDSSADVTAA